MEFSPNNHIVKLCIQGMAMEDKGQPENASQIFLQAWNEALNDFEKFISAHFVARHQKDVSDKLKWLQNSLQYALKVDNEMVQAAFSTLYFNMAKCYEELNDPDNAKKNYELAITFKDKISDAG